MLIVLLVTRTGSSDVAESSTKLLAVANLESAIIVNQTLFGCQT